MIKKLLLTLLCLVIIGSAIGLYLHFGKNNKHLRLVPSNASMVMTLDVKSLLEKADFNGKLQYTKLYKQIMTGMTGFEKDGNEKLISELIKHPLDNGLDMFNKAYVFLYGMGDHAYMGVVLAVKDEEDFKEFINKIPGLGRCIRKGEKYRIYTNGPVQFAWNENGLLLLFKSGTSYDSEETSKQTAAFIRAFITQDKSRSISQNAEFLKTMDKPQDIGIFINYAAAAIADNNAAFGGKLYKKMLARYKDVYINAKVDFKRDKIVVSAEFCGDKKAIKQLTYLNDKALSKDVLQYITNKNIYGLTSVNLNLDKILQLVIEDSEWSKRRIETWGVTPKEFFSAFTGEIVLAMTDVRATETTAFVPAFDGEMGTYEMRKEIVTQPIPTMSLSVGVKDRSNFNKLMKNVTLPIESGMRKIEMNSMPDVYMIETAYGLTMTNDSAMAADIVKNKKTRQVPAKEFSKLITKSTASFYMNLNIKDYPSEVPEFFRKELGERSASHMFDYLSLFDCIEYKNDVESQSSTLEIRLVRGGGNSLYRLLKQSDVFSWEKL